ncbi:hypothetical protein AAER28_31275 [Pseudomonas aeruginosa]
MPNELIQVFNPRLKALRGLKGVRGRLPTSYPFRLVEHIPDGISVLGNENPGPHDDFKLAIAALTGQDHLPTGQNTSEGTRVVLKRLAAHSTIVSIILQDLGKLFVIPTAL